MRLEVICNKRGVGKTTYARKTYIPHKYYIHNEWMTYASCNTTENIPYCIIDSADAIPETIFHTIVNEAVSANYEILVIVFDVMKEELSDCPNFNAIWKSSLLPRNYHYENFIASSSDFYLFLHENYPEMNKEQYDNILEITDYNFNEIDRFMLFNSLHTNGEEELNTNAIAKYIEEKFREKFRDIPDAEILLKESSIIGEQFSSEVLESPNGFNYKLASEYLKQIDKMHGFIRSCIHATEEYEFISPEVHRGIYNSISKEKKLLWINKLIEYYKIRYEHCSQISERCLLLHKLKNLCIMSSQKSEQKKYSCQLLYEYRKADNTYMALEMAREIVEKLSVEITPVLYEYIQNFRIETFMNNEEYSQALSLLENVVTGDIYQGSKMFIKYYYAYCLFQIGDVDLAYTIIQEMADSLKITSGSNRHSQELYCLVYSLLATIQNHLNIADGGLGYYRLALNHSLNKLNDQSYFYGILKKCDMLYDYSQIKDALSQCLDFYVQHENWNCAGEVCVNLATEMLFQDCELPNAIKKYFLCAQKYFSNNNFERMAYAKNNTAIYYVIYENDIERGLSLFKEALFTGLSDFTYMCIYLNICMCYILSGQIDSPDFEDAKTRFDFATKKLGKRKNVTVYETVYKYLLEIIIAEYKGENIISACLDLYGSLEKDSFFIPLVGDIMNRNHHQLDYSYNDNQFYYKQMNRLRIFLAEFRFWE